MTDKSASPAVERRSKAREGFDRLLGLYRFADIEKIWVNEYWLCCNLILEGDDESTPFAIWLYTGNVYRHDQLGAVEEDPLITVTELS